MVLLYLVAHYFFYCETLLSRSRFLTMQASHYEEMINWFSHDLLLIFGEITDCDKQVT